MNTQVTLMLPTSIYQLAEQLAKSQNKKTDVLLVEVLQDSIKHEADLTTYEPDEALEREKEAYLELHPMLWANYPGQHVAIYKGAVVDRDNDLDALWERIETNFPDVFVWVTTIEEEPIKTVIVPSFQVVNAK